MNSADSRSLEEIQKEDTIRQEYTRNLLCSLVVVEEDEEYWQLIQELKEWTEYDEDLLEDSRVDRDRFNNILPRRFKISLNEEKFNVHEFISRKVYYWILDILNLEDLFRHILKKVLLSRFDESVIDSTVLEDLKTLTNQNFDNTDLKHIKGRYSLESINEFYNNSQSTFNLENKDVIAGFWYSLVMNRLLQTLSSRQVICVAREELIWNFTSEEK